MDKVADVTVYFQRRCEVKLDYEITKLKKMTIKALLGSVMVRFIIRVKTYPFMQSFTIGIDRGAAPRTLKRGEKHSELLAAVTHPRR